MRSIIVWDLPTRAFHWALAASVILALVIIEDEGLAYAIHAILGVSALVLVLFRLVWGILGGEYARFSGFIAGWSTVRSYTLRLLRLAPPRHIGHNPLGGWAIVILIVLTLLTAATGVLTGGLLGGGAARAASDIHEAFGSLLQFMVFIHIAGVLVGWALTRDNLVAAMWHGRKRIDEASAARDARGGNIWLALVIAAPLLVFGGYVVAQIDLTEAPGRSSSESD